MILGGKDLAIFVGEGSRFEQLVYDLICREARALGIPLTDINWDHRTNMADGGQDIVISKGYSGSDTPILPPNPSIWSLKSGVEGIQPTSLRREITNPQRTLLEHLREGKCYIWCAVKPIDQPGRKKMQDEATVLAMEYGFDAKNIIFVWCETLAQYLTKHPNLIAKHLPNIASRLRGITDITTWLRESPDHRGYCVPWINIDGRDQIKKRIQCHLKGSQGSAVLHIAGFSGIGKTRTAIQACLDDPELSDTLYAPSLSSISDFLRYIDAYELRIRLIVDEVPLEDINSLANRFESCSNRVRIISIGPARKNQTRYTSIPNMMIMEEPTLTNGVLPIVRAEGMGLPDNVLKTIARWSGPDLRLALMLVESTKRNPEIWTVPIENFDGLWNRVLALYSGWLKDSSEFEKHYEMLTCSIDIGYKAEHRGELEYIARHFGAHSVAIDRAINQAVECNLGVKAGRFFEATPRALAIWFFQERAWPNLSHRLEEFMRGIPTERYRRRFLERCQELQQHKRKEVLEAVGAFFRDYLGDFQLSRLNDDEVARVFQVWAELDPERGLSWLKRAVGSATDDELRQFGEGTGYSGSWGGRRQIVWLCEHLACFAESFWDCEEILFRLAQVEIETSIRNNSTAEWKGLYLPVLSFTEIPFPKRLDHLLKRLEKADEKTIDLVISAALEAIDDPRPRPIPPAVIGGRVVPEEWRPRTREELYNLVRNAGAEVLARVGRLEEPIKRIAVGRVIEKSRVFLDLDLLAELQNLSGYIQKDFSLSCSLRSILDDNLFHLHLIAEQENLGETAITKAVKEWRESLEPSSIRERIIDMTSRDYWSVQRLAKGSMTEESKDAFRELAEASMGTLEVIKELKEWFASPVCRSGGGLGYAFGQIDLGNNLLGTVEMWLRDGYSADFVVGYVRGVAQRVGGLPSSTSRVLDGDGVNQDVALRISVDVDVSEQGFHRIIALATKGSEEDLGCLRYMGYQPWSKFLSIEQKALLLNTLHGLMDKGVVQSSRIAFDLMSGWIASGCKLGQPELQKQSLVLLQKVSDPAFPVDAYDWRCVCDSLIHVYPGKVAEILADVLTQRGWHQGEKYAEELLMEMAKSYSEEVMNALGRWILDPERGMVFGTCVMKGLFDAIDLSIVKSWVEENGEEAAIRIARHVVGPHLDKKGNPVVPELADWILTRYKHSEAVFASFIDGRYSGTARAIEIEKDLAEVQKRTAAFEQDKRDWVRKWIKYEREWGQHEAEFWRHVKDELDRT